MQHAFFFLFYFLFFHIDSRLRNEKQVVLQKSSSSRVTIVNRIPSPEIQQTKSCVVVRERLSVRASLGDTGETDTHDVKIPLRTQTTTRQRYVEILLFLKKKKKKAPRKKSVQQRRFFFASVQSRKDSDGDVRIAGFGGRGTPEHVCPLLPVPLLSPFPPLAITPSSLPRRTRTRPRSPSIPRRCGGRGWWPRRCPRARVWPPALAAPPLSAAVCLEGKEAVTGR